MNVYEQAEALLRARLVTAAGKVRRNAEAVISATSTGSSPPQPRKPSSYERN